MAKFQGKLYVALNNYLTEYKEKNDGNKYKPVAVGRYGIRTRESIYSKELAKDYSKNKVIFQNTLTVGMGSNQIDIGILDKDEIYSVSPAYHTYKISEINANYLRYCLECRNQDMFIRYVKRGSRQGKTIDLKRWLTYEIPVYDESTQQEIVSILDKVSKIIENRKLQLENLDMLVKSRFVEMFGDLEKNPFGWDTATVGNLVASCEAGWSGNGTHREKRDGEIAVLKVSAVTKGYFIPEECKVLDDQDTIKKYVYPQSGDLLFSRANTREMVGATAVITQDYPEHILPDKLWKVRFLDNANVWYMKYVLSSESIRSIFSSMSTGTSGSMFNVSMDKFKSIKFPLPPLDLQNQFADFVTQVDKSKLAVQKSLEQLEILKKSLMQAYFG